MLDILRILAAILALGLGAWLFNRDTNRLVLVPIDRMMQKVRRWAAPYLEPLLGRPASLQTRDTFADRAGSAPCGTRED